MCDSAMAIQEIYKILIQDGTISDQKKEQLTQDYPCHTSEEQAAFFASVLCFGMERTFVKRNAATKKLLAAGTLSPVSSMIIPGNRDLFFRKSFSLQRLHQNGKIGSSSGMPWNEPRKPKTAGLPENLLSHFPLNCQGRHKSHYSVISSKIILSIWECVLTLRSTTQTVIIPTPISC